MKGLADARPSSPKTSIFTSRTTATKSLNGNSALGPRLKTRFHSLSPWRTKMSRFVATVSAAATVRASTPRRFAHRLSRPKTMWRTPSAASLAFRTTRRIDAASRRTKWATLAARKAVITTS